MKIEVFEVQIKIGQGLGQGWDLGRWWGWGWDWDKGWYNWDWDSDWGWDWGWDWGDWDSRACLRLTIDTKIEEDFGWHWALRFMRLRSLGFWLRLDVESSTVCVCWDYDDHDGLRH